MDIAVRNNLKQMQVPGSQKLQVDTDLVGKMISPPNTKYCKWILSYLEKLQVPPNTKYCKWMLNQFQKLQVPMSQILQVDN